MTGNDQADEARHRASRAGMVEGRDGDGRQQRLSHPPRQDRLSDVRIERVVGTYKGRQRLAAQPVAHGCRCTRSARSVRSARSSTEDLLGEVDFVALPGRLRAGTRARHSATLCTCMYRFEPSRLRYRRLSNWQVTPGAGAGAGAGWVWLRPVRVTLSHRTASCTVHATISQQPSCTACMCACRHTSIPTP